MAVNNANGNAWGKFEMGWETEKKRCEQGKNERERRRRKAKKKDGMEMPHMRRIRNATIRQKNGGGVQDTRVVSQWERQKKDANEEK